MSDPSGEAPAASSLFAVVLLAELVARGVRDVVVCPGSRSQALALAAAEAERAGAVRLHVRADERSAGFFALGVARETGVPAPVIVTSGTAVANLLPAALEAHEGRVPMLLLTADRPVELRGIRSNQTTRQAGLFGAVTRLAVDVDAAIHVDAAIPVDDEAVPDRPGAQRSEAPSPLAARALAAALGRVGGAPPGPVQLNLAFREPLSGWPAGGRLDFGAGPMTPAQLFGRSAERRSAETGGDARPGVSADRPQPELTDAGWSMRLKWDDAEVYTHDDDALTVVVAGEGAGLEAEAFARDAGLPLLAEVVSGSRFGREAITAYATLIDDPEIGGLVERAVVFGHPTLTRQVPALLRREDVEVIVVDPHVRTARVGAGQVDTDQVDTDQVGADQADPDHYDPGRTARVVRTARVAESYASRSMHRWLGVWVVADRRLREQRSTAHEPDLEAARATGYKERSSYARSEVAALREPVTRELLGESVWRATWPHDRLVLAASRLVRVLDGLAPSRRIEVRTNRGLAGIDGTVATALGVATASQGGDDPGQAAGATRVLLGDLALLHDAGSLLLPEAEPRPRIQLFVGNDGGGTIFDTLEAATSSPAETFDRVMYTPQRVDMRALAEAYGWEYARVESRGELERLLTAPVAGPMLVEVPLAR
ncbi:MAG: 2-succinyl-5-enolpyruvyl-6-hydroxy-3-cyclohexene-1-carboxylic-acid synthase [Leucobacter sp.]